MRTPFSLATALVLTAALSSGCDLFNKDKKDDSGGSPTSPSPSVSMDVFAGTWSSVTPSTPATGCGNVKYTVIPLTTSSANVTFSGTCGGSINVTGSGTGTLSGSALNWTATPQLHGGFPSSALKECDLKQGPYDILYAAS